MRLIPAIQLIETFNSRKAAVEALINFAFIQVDNLGGRVIENYNHTQGLYAVQAFFSADGVDSAAALPDGCRLVQAPAHMLTCSLERNDMNKQKLAKARRLGADAGRNAAQWYLQDTIGGRVTRGERETARIILGGIEDGDPEILDTFPDHEPEDLAFDTDTEEGTDAYEAMRDCWLEEFALSMYDTIENACRELLGE